MLASGRERGEAGKERTHRQRPGSDTTLALTLSGGSMGLRSTIYIIYIIYICCMYNSVGVK